MPELLFGENSFQEAFEQQIQMDQLKRVELFKVSAAMLGILIGIIVERPWALPSYGSG